MKNTHSLKLRMSKHRRLAFKPSEYQHRYELVLDNMKNAGLDALLVHCPENITYLTGYETPGYYGYHCLVIVRGQQPVLVGRRIEMRTNVPEFSWLTQTESVEDHQIPIESTSKIIEKLGMARRKIGIEKSSWFFPVNEYEALRARLPRADLRDGSGRIEAARLIKSEAEVRMIRRAVAIADKATLAGIRVTKAGTTEDRIAAAVYKKWCEEGSEYTGLPNFIASGKRSGLCHSTWRGRKLNTNDHCIFEIAASKNRYAGAVFRVATVGRVKPIIRRLSDTSIEALLAVIDAIRPGIISEEVDKVGRDIIKRAGFGKHHHHRLGYSIGLNQPPDWGEGQIMSIRRGEQRMLQTNMTFHLVPGCLIAGELGIVNSATVRVTKTGCEVLNSIPLKLFEK